MVCMCQLLLWMTASTYLTTVLQARMINLNETEMGGGMSGSGGGGMSGSGRGGMSGSGISEEPSHDPTIMLQPMVANATAVITIRDDDLMTTSIVPNETPLTKSMVPTETTLTKVPTKTSDITTNEDDETANGDDRVVVAVSSVITAVAGSLIIAAIFCCVLLRYCRKRKRRIKLVYHSNGSDSSYIQFNPIQMGSRSSERHGIATPSQFRSVKEKAGLLTSELVHEDISDVSSSEFAAYVKELHRDADKGFSQQYMALQAHSPRSLPCTTAQLEKNLPKNRYNNILPYDSTRVVLNNTGQKHSDYINANWINGYKRDKTYVTCQGPLAETVVDFWRMMWEINAPTIVMLTKPVEATKEKCKQYWPHKADDTLKLDQGLSVQLQEVIPFADYDMRKLVLSCGSETRKITHYLFQAWPDHGVPRYATALLGFIRHVRKGHFPSDPSPLVVHCSAGVGRTGTFIVLDIMLQILEAGAGINVYECILNLRSQRCFMVQTEAQFIFIHDALEELITCGKTEIAVSDLRIAIKRLCAAHPDTQVTGFQQQFQQLQQVTRQPLKKNLEISQKIFNKEKNRYPEIIPYDFQRVCLKVTGQPGSDYINASWINGYRQSNAFMATQAPVKSTVNDVWRMVWEMNSRTIIMLCDLQEKDEEGCVQYWPEKETKLTYGSLTISSRSEHEINGALLTRVFEVHHNSSKAAPLQEMVTVTQFHFRGWSADGLPSNPSLLLELVDRVLKNQISTGNKPVVIMCSDGSGRSGVFVVLYTQLERLKTEHVVDVFQGIKAARTQRMGIVHNAECYKLIHELLLEYLTSFEEKNYYNFAVD